MTNFDELIRDLANAAEDESYSRYQAAKTALRSAIEKVEQERDAVRVKLERAIGDKDTYCAYCGASFPLDDPISPRKVAAHIATCEKHPMRKLEAALKEANEELAHYRSFVYSHPWLEYRVRVGAK